MLYDDVQASYRSTKEYRTTVRGGTLTFESLGAGRNTTVKGGRMIADDVQASYRNTCESHTTVRGRRLNCVSLPTLRGGGGRFEGTDRTRRHSRSPQRYRTEPSTRRYNESRSSYGTQYRDRSERDQTTAGHQDTAQESETRNTSDMVMITTMI